MTHEQPTPSELADIQALIDRHFEIWNIDDAAARMERFPAVYAPDFFVADYAGQATGHAAVGDLITRVRSQHPGFGFTPDPIAWNHGLGRVTWGYGPQDAPHTIRGEDIFTVREGRLASFHIFIDKR